MSCISDKEWCLSPEFEYLFASGLFISLLIKSDCFNIVVPVSYKKKKKKPYIVMCISYLPFFVFNNAVKFLRPTACNIRKHKT